MEGYSSQGGRHEPSWARLLIPYEVNPQIFGLRGCVECDRQGLQPRERDLHQADLHPPPPATTELGQRHLPSCLHLPPSTMRALNLLLPSATAGVSLECRLYLPSAVPSSSSPEELKPAVRALGLKKLVTAAHPWGRLGGNQDFPWV